MKQLPRLILFPLDATGPRIELDVLRHHLVELGLIGSALQHDAGFFLPGANFMNLLTFLGCSPTVSMADSEDEITNFYSIEAVDYNEAVVAICGFPAQAPRCAQCKQEVVDWSEQPKKTDALLVCDHCGFRAPLSGWNWRFKAGFGHHWINIWGVHEGEAVPGEKLLASLRELSGVEWRYAWCKS